MTRTGRDEGVLSGVRAWDTFSHWAMCAAALLVTLKIIHQEIPRK